MLWSEEEADEAMLSSERRGEKGGSLLGFSNDFLYVLCVLKAHRK